MNKKFMISSFFVFALLFNDTYAVSTEQDMNSNDAIIKTLKTTYGEDGYALFKEKCDNHMALNNDINCSDGTITCGDKIINVAEVANISMCKKEISDQEKNVEDKTKEEDTNKQNDADKNNGSDKAKKVVGTLSTAAMGIGGMQLAQGLAEQGADKETAKEISAYLSNLRCGISNGLHDVKVGTESTLPTFSTEFAKLRQEYIGIDSKSGLVGKLKSAKENLGMAPGIESEVIMDTSGLYKNNSVGTGSGQFETAEERLSGDKSRIKTGAIIAGAGAVVGVAGPMVIDKLTKSNQEKNNEEKEPVKKDDAAQK